MEKYWKYAFIGLAIIVVFGICRQKSEPYKPAPTSTQKESNTNGWNSDKEDLIKQLIASGGEVNPANHEAYLPPQFWNMIDHNKKADISCIIAEYCTHINGSGPTWANIYDKMTGKKLAKWSNTTGLSIED